MNLRGSACASSAHVSGLAGGTYPSELPFSALCTTCFQMRELQRAGWRQELALTVEVITHGEKSLGDELLEPLQRELSELHERQVPVVAKDGVLRRAGRVLSGQPPL